MKNALKFLTYYFKSLWAKFPNRLHQIGRHFIGIPTYFKKKLQHTPPKNSRILAYLPTLLMQTIVVWLALLLAKIADLLALPELLESITYLFKKNTSRPLSPLEIAEAKRVFADSLPYKQIRIDEKSLIAHTGATFLRAQQLGVCTFHTVNFTRKINPQPGNLDMAWLIHELTHIAQMRHVGSQYIGEAIYAQLTDGYNYGGQNNLIGKKLADFNREQQAEIARDFYYHILFNRKFYQLGNNNHLHLNPSVYEPYIEQLQKGEF